MNAPAYYMLHALPVVVVLGVVSYLAGRLFGGLLWKKHTEQASLFEAEIRECERVAGELRNARPAGE